MWFEVGRKEAISILKAISSKSERFDAVVADPNANPPKVVGEHCANLRPDTAADWAQIDMKDGQPSEAAIDLVIRFYKQIG